MCVYQVSRGHWTPHKRLQQQIGSQTVRDRGQQKVVASAASGTPAVSATLSDHDPAMLHSCKHSLDRQSLAE